MKIDEQRIAQNAGLWLAEGDKKTNSEITLTNNNPELIECFHRTLISMYPFERKARLYVYNKNGIYTPSIKDVEYRNYIDMRSGRPYFIYRVSGVPFVKKWKMKVEGLKKKESLYTYILQGFFAGEGNIKFSKKRKSRALRIAQGKRDEFLEKMLEHLSVQFTYSPAERSYVISGRKNLEKLLKIEIAKLHKEKDRKFREMLSSYKQHHYPKNYLKYNILGYLNKPHTAIELSKYFERSPARICKILTMLKKEGKVNNYRVRSRDYWIKINCDIIVISDRKNEILHILKAGKTTKQISNHLEVNWKAAFRRLKELERLGLVKREGQLWKRRVIQKKIVVL